MTIDEMKKCQWILKEDFNVKGIFNKISYFKYLDERLLNTLPLKYKKSYIKHIKSCAWYDINSKYKVIKHIQNMIKKQYFNMIEKRKEMSKNDITKNTSLKDTSSKDSFSKNTSLKDAFLQEDILKDETLKNALKDTEGKDNQISADVAMKNWKPDKFYIDNFLIPIEMLDYGKVHLYKYYANRKYICYLFTGKDDYTIYCDDTNSVEEIAERDFEMKIREFEEENKCCNPFGQKSFAEDDVDISNVTSIMNGSTPSTLNGVDIF